MAMILYERGLLDLEASSPPSFPSSSRRSATPEVTLRMLLTHSSAASI